MSVPVLALASSLLAGHLAGGSQDAAGPRDAPAVVWSVSSLALEGPPLALAGHVLAHGRDPSGRRALVVLERASGRALARTLFATDQPLDPRTDGERVVVRAGPGRLELLRWRGVRFVSERSFRSEHTFSRPSLAAGELVVRAGDALLHHDLARHEASWQTGPELAVRGAPAFLGDAVLALAHDARGGARLVRFARADGRLLESLALGPPEAELPPEAADAAVLARAEQVFVRLAAPVEGRGGGSYGWTRVPCETQGFGAPTLHHFLAEPLALGAGWLAPLADPAGGARWVRAPEGVELAGASHHTWLARAHTAAAAAGDVLFLGGAAVDARTHAVLWRRARAPEFPPLLLDGQLYVVEGGVLHCLAGPAPEHDPAQAGARESARRAEAGLAQRLLELGAQATRANDVQLAAAWLDEAEHLGASGRALELARAEVERASAPARRPLPDARKLAQLRTEAERARTAVLTRLLDDARGARGAERLALLSELLVRAPEHAPALAFLAALLPAGAQLRSEHAAGWLELLRAGERRALAFTAAATDPLALGTRLGAEQAAWRADAALFTSPGLALVTAGTSPGDVAAALATGEEVIEFLVEVFGPPRGGSARLDVVLYPTRAEYLAQSAGDTGGFGGALDWTAGHFDLADNVSRLFVPDGDGERERLAEVQAHELTHHWLAACSRFGPVRAAKESPGYWIVEGLALWVEERRFDTRGGARGRRVAGADSLDTLAADGARPLPWEQLLALSYADYGALETRPVAELALAWRLGSRTPRSPMQFFYAQSGALAHWLWEADGGAHRTLLVETARAYYAGAAFDLAGALGLTPEELGERVRAFAGESCAP